MKLLLQLLQYFAESCVIYGLHSAIYHLHQEICLHPNDLSFAQSDLSFPPSELSFSPNKTLMQFSDLLLFAQQIIIVL